jgi:hypothetical protein
MTRVASIGVGACEKIGELPIVMAGLDPAIQ